MRSIDTYLTFDGNCREAMTFCAAALDAKVQIVDADQGPCAPGDAGCVLHARLERGNVRLLASDTLSMTPYKLHAGNNFSLSLDCEGPEQQDIVFARLAEGGEVRMPLQDTFWGARFGMLVDRFGIQRMFNWDKTPRTISRGKFPATGSPFPAATLPAFRAR